MHWKTTSFLSAASKGQSTAKHGEQMLILPGFQRHHPCRGLVAVSGLMLFLASQLFAQSGRRVTRPPSSTSSINAELDSPAPITGERPLASKVSLLVARQSTSKHLLSEDAITADFVKTLNEFTNVSARSIGDLNRERAIKRAKSETEAIVVLLHFDIDNFQAGTIIVNSPDMDVDVRVFSPITGREKFKGKVYYKAVGGPMLKKDNWPNGTPIRITTEAVGIEAAEQVHDWLLLEEIRRKK